MKVGDLVRNAHTNLGVVVELPKDDEKYPQILVAVRGNLELWCPTVTETVDESR